MLHKEPYETPELNEIGDMAELTQLWSNGWVEIFSFSAPRNACTGDGWYMNGTCGSRLS